MHLGLAHCGNANRYRRILNGFTSGSIWNPKNGTLQDYGFDVSNIFELYIYISCCSAPNELDLEEIWHDHRTALLILLYAVRNSVHGEIVDEYGIGISNVALKVTENGIQYKVSPK